MRQRSISGFSSRSPMCGGSNRRWTPPNYWGGRVGTYRRRRQRFRVCDRSSRGMEPAVAKKCSRAVPGRSIEFTGPCCWVTFYILAVTGSLFCETKSNIAKEDLVQKGCCDAELPVRPDSSRGAKDEKPPNAGLGSGPPKKSNAATTKSASDRPA